MSSECEMGGCMKTSVLSAFVICNREETCGKDGSCFPPPSKMMKNWLCRKEVPENPAETKQKSTRNCVARTAVELYALCDVTNGTDTQPVRCWLWFLSPPKSNKGLLLLFFFREQNLVAGEYRQSRNQTCVAVGIGRIRWGLCGCSYNWCVNVW